MTKHITMVGKLWRSLLLAGLLSAAAAGSASAAGPTIGVKTLFPDYVTPGKPLLALLEVRNVGDEPMTGSLTLHYEFPGGLSFVDPAFPILRRHRTAPGQGRTSHV